jgi:hypothetical protein
VEKTGRGELRAALHDDRGASCCHDALSLSHPQPYPAAGKIEQGNVHEQRTQYSVVIFRFLPWCAYDAAARVASCSGRAWLHTALYMSAASIPVVDDGGPHF